LAEDPEVKALVYVAVIVKAAAGAAG